MLLKLISKGLRDLADRIDGDNTYLTLEELEEIINKIKAFDKERPLSKYEAYHYLHISRATFDNLVRIGKLPNGKKQQGFTELLWFLKDLDNYAKQTKQKPLCQYRDTYSR